MNKVLPVLASMLLAGCGMSPVASRVPGYLTTPQGELLMNEAGRCWRTASWRPDLAILECDPEVVRAQQALVVAEAAAPAEEKAAEAAPEEAAPKASEGIAHFGFVYQPGAEEDAEVAGTAGTASGTAASAALAEAAAAPAARYRDEIVYAPLVLNSDASFYFGDDRLTREGQEAVTEVAGIIKARRAEDLKIAVIGHTDRVGSASANLALSRRRAAAVKAALVAAGIPATAIDTAGMGASRPVTQPEDCPAHLVKCELVSCLRPDRRVEVRIRGRLPSGTRQVPLQTRLELPRPATVPVTRAAVECRA